MTTQLSHLIGLAELAMSTQKVSRTVKTRVKAGRCLLCEKEARRRGLCDAHYMTFRNRRDSKSNARDRAHFEIACIEDGKILAVGEARRIKSNDPFSENL